MYITQFQNIAEYLDLCINIHSDEEWDKTFSHPRSSPVLVFTLIFLYFGLQIC